MSDRDLLRETTRRFLEDEFPLERVRELADDNSKFDADVWRRGVELGWTALLVPESAGGGGVTSEPILDLVAVAEEMGRLVQPWPWLSANVVALALADASTHGDVLAGIASGDTFVTWAHVDADGWRGADVSLTIDGDRVTGTKTYVEDADVADYLLVTGRDGDGLTQVLVPAGAAGVSVKPLRGLDFARRLFTVRFDGAAGEAVGDPGRARESVERQLQLAFVLQCAESVGGAEQLAALTFQYAKDRYAFGRPIGSFQAVKHMCADMLVLLEGSKATTMAAAVGLQARVDDAAQLASIANGYVGAAFSKLARDAVQVHGGIGYTWEHDAHLYLRRAKANELLLGDPAWHREQLCQLVGI